MYNLIVIKAGTASTCCSDAVYWREHLNKSLADNLGLTVGHDGEAGVFDCCCCVSGDDLCDLRKFHKKMYFSVSKEPCVQVLSVKYL